MFMDWLRPQFWFSAPYSIGVKFSIGGNSWADIGSKKIEHMKQILSIHFLLKTDLVSIRGY
jgi:hypothetical protein